MLNRKYVGVFALILVMIFSLSVVSAADIFTDNFNSYSDNGDLIANGWESSTGLTGANNPIGIESSFSCDADPSCGDEYVSVQDDAILYHAVNTTGETDISFDYCRRTDNFKSGDIFKIGWKTGSYDGDWGNWEELEQIEDNETWDCVLNPLPVEAENTNILIGFFMDDGNGQEGYLDNVKVTGNEECVPTAETCNGLDDDCDSLIDEDWPDLGNVCSVGVGECASSGNLICTIDGTGTECNAIAGQPSAEVCTGGLDEDCDDSVDCADSDCDQDPVCQVVVVCSDYNSNELDCEVEGCYWCEDCNGFNIFNGEDQCVNSFQDCSYNGCDVATCGAECDDQNPCADTDCDYLDGCIQGTTTYEDYDDVPNACLGSCICEDNSCGTPTQYLDDQRCPLCEIDEDCNDDNVCTTDTCGDLTCDYTPIDCPNGCFQGDYYLGTCNSVSGCEIGETPLEICDNKIDDDCDGLVDGNDSDCQEVEGPTCTIDYLSERDGTFVFNITDYYFNQAGLFDVHGTATPNKGCYNSYVGYNRTSPNWIYYSWRESDNLGFWENWRTDQDDVGFIEGMHEVCCKVESKTCEGSGCEAYMNTSCTDFCIDATSPMNVTPEYQDDLCDNSDDVTKEDIIFNFDIEDDGCAPIQFDIMLYVNGTNVENYTINGTNTSVDTYSGLFSASTYGLQNNTSYSIKVRAIDMAGNVGDWSAMSEVIWYDNEAPEVHLEGELLPTQGTWFNADFEVEEADSDNIGLFSCEYMIKNNGDVVQDWTPTDCNQNVTIKVPEDCGEDTCTLYKRSEDLACNLGNDSEWYKIDLTPPTTTKTVGTPKINASDYPDLIAWVAILIDGWFITDDTSISFTCDDGEGIGCADTYYTIQYPNMSVSEILNYSDTGAFNLPNTDGLYNITYWSVDNVGNVEAPQFEVDKVDIEAPVTTKTIGEPQYQEGYYITDHTPMILTGNDSEVGCNFTQWVISQGESVVRNGSSDMCNASVDWICLEDGEYNITFGSQDYLENSNLTQTTQSHYLDNTPPAIMIYNPFNYQNETKCSIDVYTYIWEDGSGLNESSVKAILINSSDVEVRSVTLINNNPLSEGIGYYSSVIPVAGLPSGDYVVKVIAEDNLGNKGFEERNITLLPGITVERVDPVSCTVDADETQNCSFTFQACVRDSSAASLWISKLYTMQSGEKVLEGVVDPNTLNARITNDYGTAIVGLVEDSYGRVPKTDESAFDNRYILNLTADPCEKFNARVYGLFDLKLDFNQTISEAIGSNTYLFDYDLQAYNSDDECLIDDQ